MSRSFVSEFLLPLVRGGTLEVGRPLSRAGVEGLARDHQQRPSPVDRGAAVVLAAARRQVLAPLVAQLPRVDLDDDTWRIGAAVHDLLTLAHPRIARGPGAEPRVARISAAAIDLASLGAPTSQAQALARHSMIARLPEVVRQDSTVHFWLGRRTFMGRRPPARILALPRIRAVRVETVRRAWLRDLGVPAVARPAFLALTEASPLGEALDPLRLDPPPSWARLLSVLRFPVICRLVAGHLVEIGVDPAGDALAAALYRFAFLEDAAGPVRASGEAVAFAISFLAHVAWLDQLFDGDAGSQNTSRARGARPRDLASRAPVSAGTGPSGPIGASGASAASGAAAEHGGRELAVLLSAAQQVDPRLIWPADVPRVSDLGQRFARALAQSFDRHDVRKSARWSAALELAKLAAAAGRGSSDADAV